MQQAGFEVRHVESLREHYALTLRRWVANLEANWDEAVASASAPAGPGSGGSTWPRRRSNFEAGRTQIHQVLATRTDHGPQRHALAARLALTQRSGGEALLPTRSLGDYGQACGSSGLTG